MKYLREWVTAALDVFRGMFFGVLLAYAIYRLLAGSSAGPLFRYMEY